MKCWRCNEESNDVVLINLYAVGDRRPVQVVAEVVSCAAHRLDPDEDFTEDTWESFAAIVKARRGSDLDRELTEVWSTPMTPKQSADYIGPFKRN